MLLVAPARVLAKLFGQWAVAYAGHIQLVLPPDKLHNVVLHFVTFIPWYENMLSSVK